MRFISSPAKSPSVQLAKKATTEQGAEDVIDMNTDAHVPIKDLKTGRHCQIFLVQKITQNDAMVTASGSRFARIILRDVTGEIEGVVWNYVPLREGQYYRMDVECKLYKGELEFAVDAANIVEVETPLNVHDYVKGASETFLMACAAVVEDALEMMHDEHYRNIIGNAVQHDLIYALKTSPYGLSGPMAYSGGLLVHIAGTLRLAKVIVEQAKESEMPLNTSLVLASCILRNMGWHTTTCFVGGYLRPKDAFYMTGINRASAYYVNHLVARVELDLVMQIPETKKQALENACNEMHDIKTAEGRIATLADAMMDLLHTNEDALRSKTRGNWTDQLFTGHNI